MLLKFALEIYELQLAEGRHFLHEHPDSAASWQVPRMVALRRRQGVGEVVAHLCQYGLVTPGPDGRPKPAQKPTRFLSSAPELLQRLGQRCTQDHEHQPLTGGRAAAAAIYPPALCRAMLRGIEAQRRREGQIFEPTTFDRCESKVYTSDSCWSQCAFDRCESSVSTSDYSGSMVWP